MLKVWPNNTYLTAKRKVIVAIADGVRADEIAGSPYNFSRPSSMNSLEAIGRVLEKYPNNAHMMYTDALSQTWSADKIFMAMTGIHNVI